MGRRRAIAIGAALAGCIGVGACETYAPRALPAGADLAASPTRLTADIAKVRPAPLEAHRFDPSGGLDPTDVAVLAVLNNPELKAQRAAADVAAAQTFAAGLLPDPQIALSADFPVSAVAGAPAFPPAGDTIAYNVQPSLDLIALITHSTALRAAKASSRKADLDLLWAEWSTAQQARQLAVTALADEDKVKVLGLLADHLSERLDRSRAAFARGDLPASATGADLAAKLDADAALATAHHDATKAREELNALLGLQSEVRLDLTPGSPPADPADTALDAATTTLPERRPDLLALRAGYEAQDANLRKAILMQFPVLNLGFSHASDTSAVITNGVAATLTIPIFNRGRGEIAVQSATREQLRAEYQARLAQTVADAAAARRERETSRALIAGLESQLPGLLAMAAKAESAYRRGDIDSAAFLALEQSALNHQVALLDQKLALQLADISLETVLFIPSDPGAQR